MVSGKRIRNKSLGVAAILSAIFENVFSGFVEEMFSRNVSRTFVGVVIYVILFLVFVLLLQTLAKVRWIRVHLFKEKIVEGKWFECIYFDSAYKSPYAYGVVTTFYDGNGELVYKGDDYDLSDEFKHIGFFTSTCTSLKYYTDSHENKAILNYAYNFEHGENNQQGYGEVNFTVGKERSKYHEGKFFNSDGVVYYFRALLITNKHIIKNLDKGRRRDFVMAMKDLVDIYSKNCIGSQKDKIKNMYEMNPAAFHEFCSKEDSDGNLRRELGGFDFNNKAVLDMGAGTGRFSSFVVENVSRLVCSDSSSKMIEFLQKTNMYRKYKDKMSFIHCDHMALPAFLSEKFDYIIAGYSVGAYFNDELMTSDQKKELFKAFMSMVKSLLNEQGTIIIVESLGIGQQGETVMFEFDRDLEIYYQMLDTFGFERREIDTSFKFFNEEEAVDTIWGFWGSDGVAKIQKDKGKWILREMSGIWVKQFNG